MAERVVLLGASGQVGAELAELLSPAYDLHAFTRADADLAEPEKVCAKIAALKPGIVINAAAYTAVDKAESERERAFRVNGTAPRLIAETCAAIGARMVHYSTDYVFDGSKSGEYLETDACNPQSVYGASKHEGEQAVLAGRSNLVFRLSWVFGAAGANFPKTMLRLAKERPELRVVADQHGRPTPARLAAEMTLKALDAKLSGLYHLCAAGAVSWHELAMETLAAAELSVPIVPIVPIATSDYPTPAKRPANSVLNSAKLETALGLAMPSWKPYLKQMIKDSA
jgi:dTDP-4-dehydrorhamnose reductase